MTPLKQSWAIFDVNQIFLDFMLDKSKFLYYLINMSDEQDYRSKFKTSAEVLHNLLENKSGPVSDQFLRWKLWLNWKEIVGPTVGDNAEPISYRNGILWLWVRNSVWMQQMTFMVVPIKNVINQKFKSNFVQEVRLTLDRRQTPNQNNEEFKKNLKRFVK